MYLRMRTLSQFVQDMATAVQGYSREALDLSVGSVIRAILEAQASVALWLQVLVADVFEASRAGTARGEKLDTWMADFAFARLPAVASAGYVKFTRGFPDGEVLVPERARLKSSDGLISFIVASDKDHPAWDDQARGYRFAGAQLELELPIICEEAGIAGNVGAGAISMLASAIAGVESVVNVQPTIGGVDAEDDAAFRSRFLDYINSRSRATTDAVSHAIRSIRQGLQFRILENRSTTGDAIPGQFLVVVDDGTRDPTDGTVEAVAKAIESVRPLGSGFAVQRPIKVNCDISCVVELTAMASAQAAQVRLEAERAIKRYVLGLGIGEILPLSRIAQIVYTVDPRIRNVLDVRLNGQAVDVVPGETGAIVPIMVSVA